MKTKDTNPRVIDACKTVGNLGARYEEAIALLRRITTHPQLPVESVQCLRDAKRFLIR